MLTPTTIAPVVPGPGGTLAFDAVENHFLRRGQGLEFEMEADWIRRRLANTRGPVLDVGCGIGALFPHLGRHVVGTDAALGGLVHTRRRFPEVPLFCATADRLPLGGSTFAAITLQHVIEHLDEPAAAAAEWFRILDRRGVLLIMTPNADFCDPSAFDDPTHVRLFDPEGLAGLLTGVGFTVRNLRTLGLPWFRSRRATWRLRRSVVGRANALSALPGCKWRGQTLCCAATKAEAE